MIRIRLGDYCIINAGGDKPRDYSDTRTDRCCIPIYANGSENDGLYGYTTVPKVLEKSVTISARGNCGYIAYRENPYCPIIRLISIIPYADKNLDAKYLYYLLKFKSFFSTGSVQKQITIPIVSDYLFDIFEDKEYQQKIAKILWSIDSKIKINDKINSELESLAKTLYDYWFLQFEFPNAEGKPYKSSGGKMVYNEQLKKEIPEGWEVAKISNLSKLISGYPFKTENFLDGGKYKIYTIRNVQDGFIDNVTDNNIDFIPKDINKDCVLSYGDLIMSLTGNVGRVGLVFEENALLNQRVLKIKPLDGFFNYIYLTFRENAFKNIMQRIAGGTSQKNLSPNQVGDFLVVKPNKQILALFNDKLNGFFDSFINNLRQNQELTKLRDFLLPLLMNGQVTIQDAEQQVKNTISDIWNAEKLLRFAQWKQMQGYAARGDVDDEILKKIFDAMDEDDKK